MQTKEIRIFVSEYENFYELGEQEQNLVERARQAALMAYAPYSGFKVGSALLMVDGSIITGSNQENASSPEGLCAERTAIFWANANFPEKAIVAIAISAIDKSGKHAANLSPCGSCRQVMLETEHRFRKPIRVILDSSDKIRVLNNVEGLLPLNFNGDSLR